MQIWPSFFLILLLLAAYASAAGSEMSRMEWDIDRPGSDYKNFVTVQRNPQLCQDQCAVEENCTVWAFVTSSSVCWLKTGAPDAKLDNNVVSGTKKSAICRSPAQQAWAVTLHPQETNMWCWAASGQMVMDFLGHNVTQCTQANNRFGRNDCCNTPTPEACVNGGWPEFDRYHFSFRKTTNAALSWENLRNEIACGRRPFAFTWAWPGGGGHMMAATGYRTLDNINYVEMLDPWPPNVGDHRFITYDYYVSSPNDHAHWDDYYDVRYVGE